MSTLEKTLRFGYKIAEEYHSTHKSLCLLKNDTLIAQIEIPYASRDYDISDYDDYVVVRFCFENQAFLLTDKFCYQTRGSITKQDFTRTDRTKVNLFFVSGYRGNYCKGLRVLAEDGRILYANDDLCSSDWSHEGDLLFIEKYIDRASKTLVKTLAIIDLRTLRVY